MNNKLWSIISALLLSLCGGCIENDVPYPIIAGEVKNVSFAGQTSMSIDPVKRVITLELNDTVDMRAVEVLTMEVSPESRSTIKKGDLIDFSNGNKAEYILSDSAYKFLVSTYQDYEWRIEAKQPLGLAVALEGSVGDAAIDTKNKNVVVNVSEETANLYGVVVEEFRLGPASATYSPDPLAETVFVKPKKFTVSYFDLTQEWTIAVVPVKVNVVTGSINAWAQFAEVTGEVSSSSTQTPTFEFREKAATEWQSAPAVRVGGKISGVLKNLLPNRNYVWRAKLGEEAAEEKSFKTQAKPQLENMGFEEWKLEPGGKTWFPNATAASTFWASGNPGVTMPLAGNKPSNTVPTTEAKEGEKAARIETIAVPVVNLAAGSIFTGDFIFAGIATPLNSTKFSRPYTGKPTQLSFWYKYAPKVISVAKNKPEELNKMDRCLIYIYLGDWEGILLWDQLKKEKTPGVIAYGEFVSDKEVSAYTKQTINIEYYDKKKPIKKILIVGTSSIYGDYYTGGVGSTLFLDDLQFGWDYVE